MNEEIDNENEESYSTTPKGTALLTNILETEKVPEEYLGMDVLEFLMLFVVGTNGAVPIPDGLMGREDLAGVPLREMPGVIQQLKEALLNSVP